MSDGVRVILLYLVAIAALLALQPLLVSWQHPQAVWLWCHMLKLCSAT